MSTIVTSHKRRMRISGQELKFEDTVGLMWSTAGRNEQKKLLSLHLNNDTVQFLIKLEDVQSYPAFKLQQGPLLVGQSF